VAIAGRRVSATLAYADLATALGRHEQAVSRLRALVDDEPLHEGLHSRLMLALAGSGQQGAALGQFADLRARLADELGIEPGPEIAAAHLRVLRQDVPGVARQDATPAATRPGRPALVAPAQLPADAAAFTGRAAYLRQLDALVPDRATAVVISAIAGTAGVGKTALAVHWAHRVRNRIGGRWPAGQSASQLDTVHSAAGQQLDGSVGIGQQRPQDVVGVEFGAAVNGKPASLPAAERPEPRPCSSSACAGRAVGGTTPGRRAGGHPRRLPRRRCARRRRRFATPPWRRRA
jgi:hypothetical protein